MQWWPTPIQPINGEDPVVEDEIQDFNEVLIDPDWLIRNIMNVMVIMSSMKKKNLKVIKWSKKFYIY